MAEQYLAWTDRIDGDPRSRYLDLLLERLPSASQVLDLGCGAGVPSTARLAEDHIVIGVDISSAQLRLASSRVAHASLVRADIGRIALRDQSLDAVTAFYSFGHIPRERHAAVLAEIFSALRPGGLLLATMSVGGCDDEVQDDFVGVPMFFSGFDAEANQRLLTEAGYSVLVADPVTTREPEGEARFLWLLGQRPAR